jgi:hypothetical protein
VSILDDIRKSTAARAKLEAIAKGGSEQLTADEAERLLSHMRWLSSERDSLLSSGAFDD